MKAYSMDLRERIVAARRWGESVERVAARFGVCTKTVRAYDKRAAAGRLAPTPQKGKARRLNEQQHQELGVLVQERSDWTLESLAQAWHERNQAEKSTEEKLPTSTLHDALGRLGVTYKKRVESPLSVAPSNARPFESP